MNFQIFSIKIFQILENSPKFKTLEEGQAVLVTGTNVPWSCWWSHKTDTTAAWCFKY